MQRYWPLPYSGVPGILSILGLITLIFTLIIASCDWCSEFLFLGLFFLGYACIFASIGRKVVIGDGEVVLEYGFPVTVYRVVLNDVVEACNFWEIEGGRIINYFRLAALQFLLIMVFPFTYIWVRLYTSGMASLGQILATILPLILALTTCLLLAVQVLVSSRNRRRALRIIGYIVVSSIIIANMVIAILYNQLYGEPITSNTSALLLLVSGETAFLIVFAVVVMVFYKTQIVVVRDSLKGYYAIGCWDREDAIRLVEEIVEKTVIGGNNNVKTTS